MLYEILVSVLNMILWSLVELKRKQFTVLCNKAIRTWSKNMSHKLDHDTERLKDAPNTCSLWLGKTNCGCFVISSIKLKKPKHNQNTRSWTIAEETSVLRTLHLVPWKSHNSDLCLKKIILRNTTKASLRSRHFLPFSRVDKQASKQLTRSFIFFACFFGNACCVLIGALSSSYASFVLSKLPTMTSLHNKT